MENEVLKCEIYIEMCSKLVINKEFNFFMSMIFFSKIIIIKLV